MISRFILVIALPVVGTVFSAPISGQDADRSKPPVESSNSDTDVFELNDETREVLFPLFKSILDAKVSRATVELSAETIVGGQVVDVQKSTYQIASRSPNEYTIYLKEPEQRTRIYNNTKTMTVALAPDAYVQFDSPQTIREAVDGLPVAMGPYPEPVLALTMAGFDPAITMIGGMESIELVGKTRFRGKTPAFHLTGKQDDRVTWDLWLTRDEAARPLRMTVDLTEMLRASKDMRMPPGYQYRLRFDFLSWRVTGKVQDSLFAYRAPENARQFDSVQQYFETLAGVAKEHPLLGKPMPKFAGVTGDGRALSSQDLENQVVVLDFWATWCQPCLTAMPMLETIAADYRDDRVRVFAVNVGESAGKVRGFVTEQGWKLPVILDSESDIAEAFRVDALPQRIIVGKSGVVESVHLGFAGNDALRKQLTDELDVLKVGGRIASGKE